MEGLLRAHAEAHHRLEFVHAQSLDQEGAVRADAVCVPQVAHRGEEGLVGRGAGLPVARHRGDDDVVLRQRVVGRGGEGEGGVDQAAVAGGDEDGAVGGGGVVRAVGDAQVREGGAGGEGEGGDGVVLDAGGVVGRAGCHCRGVEVGVEGRGGVESDWEGVAWRGMGWGFGGVRGETTSNYVIANKTIRKVCLEFMRQSNYRLKVDIRSNQVDNVKR